MPTTSPAAPASPTAQVRQAYADLQRHPGDWVPLADIRERLTGLSREQQDKALLDLGVTNGVHLITWDNYRALRPRDHEASIWFGGEPNHAIRIES